MRCMFIYVKEPRRADKQIPPALRSIDNKIKNVDEYEIFDVNDYMEDFSGMQTETPLFVAASSRSF